MEQLFYKPYLNLVELNNLSYFSSFLKVLIWIFLRIIYCNVFFYLNPFISYLIKSTKGGNRTHTPEGTRFWIARVYQFRHFGKKNKINYKKLIVIGSSSFIPSNFDALPRFIPISKNLFSLNKAKTSPPSTLKYALWIFKSFSMPIIIS